MIMFVFMFVSAMPAMVEMIMVVRPAHPEVWKQGKEECGG